MRRACAVQWQCRVGPGRALLCTQLIARATPRTRTPSRRTPKPTHSETANLVCKFSLTRLAKQGIRIWGYCLLQIYYYVSSEDKSHMILIKAKLQIIFFQKTFSFADVSICKLRVIFLSD